MSRDINEYRGGRTKKVVVTGGAGFIGSHLAEELSARGYYVVILDDLSTGKKENIESLLKEENVEFVKGSVSELPLLQGLFHGVHYVFHLAALPSVPRSIEEPQASHEVNATGTLNVLLAARDKNVRKVVYASSSSVYGDTPTLPKTEDMLPEPQSPYAVSKLAGEYYCRVFHRVYALPYVCLRYFNVYGPRQDANSQYAAVIPKFMKSVSEGGPPIIFGDGKQTRDFTFAKDAVEANIRGAESQLVGIFNIGRSESVSIDQLARLIIRLMGGDVEPVNVEPRPGDIMHSLADISRAREFGYEPRYSLEEGLRQSLEWFRL
jgi:UDP-glucose 4-epimerase